MNDILLGQYMKAHESTLAAGRKTRCWFILDRGDGLLGEVSWFGRWRQYAFKPYGGTTFNPTCLSLLAQFCAIATDDHRMAIREKKAKAK